MSEFDKLVDDLTEADRENPSLPQMIEDDTGIANNTDPVKKKRQAFYHPDQLRDQGGKFVDEGKHADESDYKDPDEAGLTGIDKRIVDYVAHRPLTRRHEDVRSIRKYVPGIHYVPYSKTPFFDKLNELQGTPDVTQVNIKTFAEARKKLFKAQPTQILKIDDLIATQPVVNKDKVKRNVKEDKIKALAVVNYGDKHFVMDGHHALAAAAKRGDHSIEAHVLEMDDTQKFDAESGKTQRRDSTGKFAPEGGGTTIAPRLPGLTRSTAQPVLPGYRQSPHRAEEFYSPNDTEMTWHSALDAMKGERQKVALDVTHDVDFQLGLKSRALNAIGDWSDGAENSVVNEIDNIRDFDELRYSAALKGKQLHQKAVLAFEEDKNGPARLYSMLLPSYPDKTRIGILRDKLDHVDLQNRTILPEGNNTRIVIYDATESPLTVAKLTRLATEEYTHESDDQEKGFFKIEVTKGNGEFVGEAEGRTEAGSNYDKIIRDYEAKYTDRRRYQRAAGPGDYDNRNKVSAGTTHLSLPVTSKKYGDGGSSTVFVAKFADGSKGIWKPESGASSAGRDYIDTPISPREVTAYEVAKKIGLDDLVPETISREVEGEKGSMQDFVMDAEIAGDVDSQYEYDGDKDLARAAAFDYLIGNTDRHHKNWMIANKDHSMHLIDNGLSFPTQDGGFANEYLMDEVKSRNMSVPAEASKWVDALPDIKRMMDAHGLGSSYEALKRRAYDLATKGEFRELGHFESPEPSSKPESISLKSPANATWIKPTEAKVSYPNNQSALDFIGPHQIIGSSDEVHPRVAPFSGSKANVIPEDQKAYDEWLAKRFGKAVKEVGRAGHQPLFEWTDAPKELPIGHKLQPVV